MKKTALLLALLATTTFGNFAFAQNQKANTTNCMTSMEDPQMLEMAFLIKVNNISGVEKILKTKCFDSGKEKDYFVYYMAKSFEALNLLEKFDRNPNYTDYLKKFEKSDRQLLSEAMVSPLYYTSVLEDIKQENKNPDVLFKKYGVSKEDVEKNDKPILDEESREKFLKYVADKTIKKSLITKDGIDFNAYAYAIYLSEPTVLEILLKNSISKRDLTVKNIHEVAPVHLAFAPKVFTGTNEKVNEEKLKKTNDLIVEYLDKKYVPLLSIRTIPFWTYVELYKNNNLDLYNKLKEKHNFKAINLEFFKKDSIKPADLDIKTKLIELDQKSRTVEKK